ncbi:mannose-binding protein-like [Saccoglossus kowalevskii]
MHTMMGNDKSTMIRFRLQFFLWLGLLVECIVKGTPTYVVVEMSMDWHDAKTECESRSGKLAEIHSQAEQNEIEPLLPSGSYWIGVNDMNDEDRFEYATGGRITYNNWDDGQPNNFLNQDCVVLQGESGSWNDDWCNVDSSGAVCDITS